MTRLVNLSAALLAAALLPIAAMAQSSGPPLPPANAAIQPKAAVPSYATPRDPFQPPQPGSQSTEINPYFRKNQPGQQTNSPLYQPYQPNVKLDPFAPPAAYQGNGAKSSYQRKTENPPLPRDCTNFNRIGDTYANCKAAQSKETFASNQLKAQQQRMRQ